MFRVKEGRGGVLKELDSYSEVDDSKLFLWCLMEHLNLKVFAEYDKCGFFIGYVFQPTKKYASSKMPTRTAKPWTPKREGSDE